MQTQSANQKTTEIKHKKEKINRVCPNCGAVHLPFLDENDKEVVQKTCLICNQRMGIIHFFLKQKRGN